MTKKQKIWNILVNIGTQKKFWSKKISIIPKKSSLTSRQIKNQLDKMQIWSKKLLTKQSQIPKIYSYFISLALLLSTSLSLSLSSCSPPISLSARR